MPVLTARNSSPSAFSGDGLAGKPSRGSGAGFTNLRGSRLTFRRNGCGALAFNEPLIAPHFLFCVREKFEQRLPVARTVALQRHKEPRVKTVERAAPPGVVDWQRDARPIEF